MNALRGDTPSGPLRHCYTGCQCFRRRFGWERNCLVDPEDRFRASRRFPANLYLYRCRSRMCWRSCNWTGQERRPSSDSSRILVPIPTADNRRSSWWKRALLRRSLLRSSSRQVTNEPNFDVRSACPTGSLSKPNHCFGRLQRGLIAKNLRTGSPAPNNYVALAAFQLKTPVRPSTDACLALPYQGAYWDPDQTVLAGAALVSQPASERHCPVRVLEAALLWSSRLRRILLVESCSSCAWSFSHSRHDDCVAGLQFDVLLGVFTANNFFVIERNLRLLPIFRAQHVYLLGVCELREATAARDDLQYRHLWEQWKRSRPYNFADYVNPPAIYLLHHYRHLGAANEFLQTFRE